MTRSKPSPMAPAGRGQPSSRDREELAAYVAAKHALTDLVADALRTAELTGDPDRAEGCRDILWRLADSRFNLAVVGQFKRGKSTLMNAIIGRDLLPTGVLPLTSVVTSLAFGAPLAIRLRRTGWAMEQEINPADLVEYVTEVGNPGNEKRVEEALVEVPASFLRRGLFFVDTPGLGSAVEANTATTRAFLPDADALVFVTGIDAPLSETEVALLRDLDGGEPRMFVVANKIDLLSGEDRSAALDYVRDQIVAILRTPPVGIFGVSARDALRAKIDHDATRALPRAGCQNSRRRLDRGSRTSRAVCSSQACWSDWSTSPTWPRATTPRQARSATPPRTSDQSSGRRSPSAPEPSWRDSRPAGRCALWH